MKSKFYGFIETMKNEKNAVDMQKNMLGKDKVNGYYLSSENIGEFYRIFNSLIKLNEVSRADDLIVDQKTNSNVALAINGVLDALKNNEPSTVFFSKMEDRGNNGLENVFYNVFAYNRVVDNDNKIVELSTINSLGEVGNEHLNEVDRNNYCKKIIEKTENCVNYCDTLSL